MNPQLLKQRIIFRRLIQALIIIAVFLMALTPIDHENDIFWQLKMGEQIFQYHHFPITDPYNHSNPGAVWTLEEWLPAVSFYLINSFSGTTGLIIYKAIIISITYLLFMIIFNRLKVNLYLSLFVLLLAAMVNTRGVWVVFPSIFEYLFLVITLLILEYYQSRKRHFLAILLAILALIWPQSHGSFFLLTIIVGCYLFGDLLIDPIARKFPSYRPISPRLDTKSRKYLLLVVIWSMITPFMSPNGYWLFIYPFRISFGNFTSYVSEYQKFWNVWNWNWADFIHGFTVILTAIITTLFLSSWRRLHPRDILLAIIFIGLALIAVRHVAIFALVALFLICRYLGVWFGEYRGLFKRTIIKDTILILLIIFFVYFYKTQIVKFGFDMRESSYPKQAAELINNSLLPGNMFNHYNYGGYLIWKMPNYKVFVDGRLEMYLGQAGQDYLTILTAKPGYEKLLEKYQINFLINYLTDPIVEKLVEDDNWRYIYNDNQYIVLVKNSPQNRAFIEQYWSKSKEDQFHQVFKDAITRYKADYFNQKGLEEIKKRQVWAAITNFQQSIAYDPNFLTARFNLAQAYIDFGLLTESYKEYKTILSIQPNNELATKNRDKIEKLIKLYNIAI